MNPYKFLFVTCVNNEELYEMCVKHIQKLIVPPNFTVELLPVRGAKSMAAGYNQALANDAKYKIYLHQDTFILNTNLIMDLLLLFQSNPRLGLIGTIGCKTLPPNGSWWGGQDLIGKFVGYHEKAYFISKYREISTPFEPVESVDGYFMATQYDIPWREDIFTGFHFYDASQTLEFIFRGYLVGVAKQIEPWTMHVNPFKTIVYDEQAYQYYQNIFIQHYGHILKR
jgi:hypothetical protein